MVWNICFHKNIGRIYWCHKVASTDIWILCLPFLMVSHFSNSFCYLVARQKLWHKTLNLRQRSRFLKIQTKNNNGIMIDVSVVLKVSCKKCIYHITENRNTNLIRISSLLFEFLYRLDVVAFCKNSIYILIIWLHMGPVKALSII